MDTARSVTRELCEAIGDNDRMWAATSRLISASGMPDPDKPYAVLEAFETGGVTYTKKLWRWLVAAAERANEVGEYDVPAMAHCWATNWITNVQPTLGRIGSDSARLRCCSSRHTLRAGPPSGACTRQSAGRFRGGHDFRARHDHLRRAKSHRRGAGQGGWRPARGRGSECRPERRDHPRTRW